ncbi:MAG TPA: hypothetical protein VK003_21705 [Oceanobacillus sp.]|nr:hypothetical protein [Oceanobacillus sp.]
MRRFFNKHQGCLGCLGLGLALVFCVGTLTFAIDRVCYTGLSQRLPIYPNAEVRLRRHNMFSEFGMGNTAITLYSPDDPAVVRQWYGRQTGEYIRGTMDNGGMIDRLALRIAQGDWDVTRDESGTGSLIILFGTCAN